MRLLLELAVLLIAAQALVNSSYLDEKLDLLETLLERQDRGEATDGDAAKTIIFDVESCYDACEHYWYGHHDQCLKFCRRVYAVDVKQFNEEYVEICHNEAEAAFKFLTNMTMATNMKLAQATQAKTTFMSGQVDKFRKLLGDTQYYSRDILRQMKLITFDSANPSDRNLSTELVQLSSKLQRIYGSGKVSKDGKVYMLPQLEGIFATSRDPKQLLWAWKEWRSAVGPPIRALYPRYVELLNKGATDNGFADAGDFLRQSHYESTDLEDIVDTMWTNIKPVYEQLHAYVRRKLKDAYPGEGIDDDGPIPAHLLGNMWGQTWEKLFKMVIPYPEAAQPDITSEMLAQGYTANKMYKTAEEFFTSLGFNPMTQTFWDKSMFEKPAGRNVQCHPLAFDMFEKDDFRIKMCTRVNDFDLTIVHHEMGHIGYFMQYEHQPPIYRAGANSAFHEAVGDVIALSVNTPSHLRKIGLLKSQPDPSLQQKRDINFLMKQALLKIAFIPFGMLIDKWRWEVFRGNIKPTEYNAKWWEMRLRYQGLKPPVSRSEDDFDPASKFHIAYNIPYIRYFFSFQVQFQFHKALCDASGHVGDIYKCDIYQSADAGHKLRQMLRYGRKYHWKYLMKKLTGQTTMDNTAMIEYFQPLVDWLKQQNAGSHVGWTTPS